MLVSNLKVNSESELLKVSLILLEKEKICSMIYKIYNNVSERETILRFL